MPSDVLRCVNAYTMNCTEDLVSILAQAVECRRQMLAIGEQVERLPDGTDIAIYPIAEREIRDLLTRPRSWRSEVRIACWKVFREVQPFHLRRQLLILIGILVGWVAEIDARSVQPALVRGRIKEKVGTA
jgi:hypothetical protein